MPGGADLLIASGALASQARDLPLVATPELCAGKTYIVTGTNVGLGFEAAKHPAHLGARRVILGVRRLVKGRAAELAIDRAAGTAGRYKSHVDDEEEGEKDPVVQVWPLDLARPASVRAFARRAAAELDRLDAVLANAAVAFSTHSSSSSSSSASSPPSPLRQRERDKQGQRWATAKEQAEPVAVNVLGTLLLAVLLLPVMRRKAGSWETKGDGAAMGGDCGVPLPRLVVVTSRAGFGAGMREEWDRIREDPIRGDGRGGYHLTKLAETLAVRHLAREVLPLDGGGVIINLVCPGLCATELSRHAPPETAARLRDLHAKYGRTAEVGSRTLLHVAVVAGAESHGKLLHSCADGEPDVPDWVKNETGMQKHTWEVIAMELEAIEPGCVGKLGSGLD
ncbi:hypothetical protein VTG60DRAFT_2097 [Thermothelomyces hinnuleus]